MERKKKKSQLVKYIENIYKLESSVYQQNTFIERLKTELMNLPANRPSHTVGCLGPMIGAAIGGGVCLLPTVLGLEFIGFIFLAIGGMIAIVAIGRLFKSMAEYGSTMGEHYNAESEYYEGVERRDEINRVLPVLQRKMEETEALLEEYYDQDVIFPKYRNLIAISSFYEYFSSGRCVRLTGEGGAYSTFEWEMRQDMIIAQLDEVIDQLVQIKQSQYALYEAIQRSDRMAERLYNEMIKLGETSERTREVFCDELDRANKNLVLANHIADLTRKEIEYRNFLDHNSTYLHQ